MITDSISVRGSLQIVKFNSNGEQVDRRDVNNLVVAVGKSVIASRLVGNSVPIFSHMAVGSANIAPTTSQTALNTELGRVALSSTTRTNNSIVYVGTFPAGTGTGTLAEAGIFNDGVSGDMLCRSNFNAVTKGAGDIIAITWNVTIF